MAKHNPDLVLCRKQPGVSIGRVCEKCDGICCICHSFVNPSVPVQVCDACSSSATPKCVICGSVATTEAFYCRECVQLGQDREGCPNAVNLGSTRTDWLYDRRKFKTR